MFTDGPSGDELSYSHNSLAHQLMLKSVSYSEDPFAQLPWPQDERVPDTPSESPSTDTESRYLSFAATSQVLQVYDQSYQPCSIDIQAQLHGMFFLAESQWPGAIDGAAPQSELTCYRRNLFQITGHAVMPRDMHYVATKDGRRNRILELNLAVTATESVEGNPVKLVSVPWKTQSGIESPNIEEKSDREPVTIVLNGDHTPGAADSDACTTAFQWKRMQFRIATANNGRRKELQQHFNLHLKVLATIPGGEKLCIARSQSSAIIVRGRSPRNFAARKDIPLSNSSTSRKHVPSLIRTHGSSLSTTSTASIPNPESGLRDDTSQRHVLRAQSTTNEAEIDLNGWQQYPFSIPSQTMTPATFMDCPSPASQSAFDFHFAPHELIATNGVAPSVYYDSGDEATSAYISQQVANRSSRPPTSNPSPGSLEQGPRCYMGCPVPPVFVPEGSPSVSGPGTQFHHSHFQGSAPATLSCPRIPRTAVGRTRTRTTDVAHQTPTMPSSPQLTHESELIYQNFQDLCPNTDLCNMEHYQQRPILACQRAISSSGGQLYSRRKKRDYSEVDV